MNPKRQSIPGAGAYRMLHGVLADLRRAEQTLAEITRRAPDPERAVHLAAIRAAIAQLEASVLPRPGS